MKKAKTIFSSTLLLLSAVAILASCNPKTEESSSPTSNDSKTSSVIPPASSDTGTSSKKDEHVHTFASTWSYDDNKHWHEATCEHTEEKKDLGDHTFDEGSITTAPDFEKGGEKTFTCTVCGMTKKEDLPVLVGAYLPVKTVSSIAGRTIISGTLANGEMNVNDSLMVSGANKQAVIKSMKLSGKSITKALPGDLVEIELTGVTKDEIKIGDCLYTPNFLKEVNELKVDLSVLTTAEGGEGTAIKTKYHPNVYLYQEGETNNYVTNVEGSVILPKGLTSINAGETKEATVYLETPFALRKGMTFELRMGSKKIAKGTIKETANHTHEPMYEVIGKCGECSLDQYQSFAYVQSNNTYEFETDLVEDETIFLEITPDGGDTTNWAVVAYGANYDEDFTLTVIKYDGTPLKSEESLETNVRYIVRIEAHKSKEGFSVVVMDENDMA